VNPAAQFKPGWLLAATALAGFALTAVVLIALKFRGEPEICGPGLVTLGPVCCAAGQKLEAGRCVGEIVTCPKGLPLAKEPTPGCAKRNRIVELPGGTLSIGPIDWEAEGKIQARNVVVKGFSIDTTEVTAQRWQECVRAKSCKQLEDSVPAGHPVTGISPSLAERYCMFVGGRLPSSDEWLVAATGSPARRYPWGNTGLVCRRAAFGLLKGPCASGAIGPTIAGSRPTGRTPEGLYDMAGNVAEWTREGKKYIARGGSFRSTIAQELKAWSSESTTEPSGHIGFRCAYDEAS
jgi:formylglycine-generating enzyme required for sulfatase activity